SNSLFIQIGMITLAGCIVFLYVMPTVETINATKNKTAQYQVELDRVTGVNSLLDSHIEKIDSIANAQKNALNDYLPNSVDEIAVLRDIEAIVAESGSKVLALDFADVPSDASLIEDGVEVESDLVPHTFSLGVTGSYQDIKNLFSLLETNKYQLYVETVELTPNEGDSVSATIKLVVYSLKADALVGESRPSANNRAVIE
ncbi:MAG: hypothetical protein RLZZ70_555, partial [Candidatus Parcubacteria bacterium]